jgi:hypothetical protein
MNKGEPPSLPYWKPSLFRVGKNRDGHWVVQDSMGLRGGLFIDRAEAIKFAMYESGKRPQAVIMVPGTLELDINAKPFRVGTGAGGGQIRFQSAA